MPDTKFAIPQYFLSSAIIISTTSAFQCPVSTTIAKATTESLSIPDRLSLCDPISTIKERKPLSTLFHHRRPSFNRDSLSRRKNHHHLPKMRRHFTTHSSLQLQQEEEGSDFSSSEENGLMRGDEDEEYFNFDGDELLDILTSDLGVDDVPEEELQELEQMIMEESATPDGALELEDPGLASAASTITTPEISTVGLKKDQSVQQKTPSKTYQPQESTAVASSSSSSTKAKTSSPLEEALLEGVVSPNAGVGSQSLPGDYGFDPLNLATKDYFKQTQNFILNLIPEKKYEEYDEEEESSTSTTSAYDTNENVERPPALILRDYREAEIRHGRLAMLAAILWPLQEILDRIFLPPAKFGSTTIIYGGTTLPFLSLLMTLCMLLLGYLDIYAKAVKDMDAGEAFLPGECFWDPLNMLGGADDIFKRKMQTTELNNGRYAMMAVLAYILEEGFTHNPLITLPWNNFLFEPIYTIPSVREWLDEQFVSGGTLPL